VSRAEVLAAGCDGKEGFETFTTANQVRRRRLRGRMQHRRLEVYKCRFCPKFHIGTPPKRRTRKRAYDDADRT